MKKFYETPLLDVQTFFFNDILTVSGLDMGDGDIENGWGDGDENDFGIN